MKMSCIKKSCFYCKFNKKNICSKLKLKVDNSQSCSKFKANKKKTGKKAKNKGNAFENTISKIYSEILGVRFKRVPASGGLRWKNRSDVIGDITITDEDYRAEFVVECKNSEAWNLRDLLFGNDNTAIKKYITQAEDETKRAGKPFHLIIKSKGYKPIVIVDSSINIKTNSLVYNCKYTIVTLKDWITFLKKNKKDLIKNV